MNLLPPPPPPNLPADWPHMGEVCRFSLCRKYRFTLWRHWGDCFWGLCDDRANAGKYLQVIGLNPSTADENKDDPTIRRCIDFAKRWGFEGLAMTNLFAYRATDPKEMKAIYTPVGEENDYQLLRIAQHAGMVLAAWGAHGSHKARDNQVIKLLRGAGIEIHALRLTKGGHPQHPLYIPASTQPFVMQYTPE